MHTELDLSIEARKLVEWAFGKFYREFPDNRLLTKAALSFSPFFSVSFPFSLFSFLSRFLLQIKTEPAELYRGTTASQPLVPSSPHHALHGLYPYMHTGPEVRAGPYCRSYPAGSGAQPEVRMAPGTHGDLHRRRGGSIVRDHGKRFIRHATNFNFRALSGRIVRRRSPFSLYFL